MREDIESLLQLRDLMINGLTIRGWKAVTNSLHREVGRCLAGSIRKVKEENQVKPPV